MKTASLLTTVILAAAGAAFAGTWTLDPATGTLTNPDTPWTLTVSADGTDLTVTDIDARPRTPAPLPLSDALDGGCRVTAIGDRAFADCATLAAVTIPASVTGIGEAAFADCPALTNIAVAAGNAAYRDIGGTLFSKDGSLLVQYPAGRAGAYAVPDGTTDIGETVFSGCATLTAVTIPAGVTGISGRAFTGCVALTNIAVAAGNAAFRDIGGALFSKDGKRLLRVPGGRADAYAIPDGTAGIGASAFSGCRSLTAVTIPESVTDIGDWAFEDCRALTAADIPAGIASIGEGAFLGCRGLTAVSVPAGTASIGDAAFAFCHALINIAVAAGNAAYRGTGGALFSKDGALLLQCPGGKDGAYAIPHGTASVGAMAFAGCRRLTAVTVPATVTGIGGYAFSSCPELKAVTFQGACPASVGTAVFDMSSGTKTYITRANAASWAAATGASLADGIAAWQGNALHVASEWLFNGTGTLSHSSTRWSLTVAATGTDLTIKRFARADRAPLPLDDAIIGGHRITAIGDSAFLGCGGLTAVTIPASVTNIGQYAFAACDNLASVTIPEGVADIDMQAFLRCTGLTAVTLPASVTNVGFLAFRGCTGLTNIAVAAGSATYSSIGGSLFSRDGKRIVQCLPRTEGAYDIPAGVTHIGSGAFAGCDRLTGVNIPPGVTDIDSSAFVDCAGLTSVAIPEGVASIDLQAFAGCTGLTSVTIPASVTRIGREAFSRDFDHTAAANAYAWASFAGTVFNDCTSLTNIAVAAGTTAYRDIGGVLFSADGKRLLQLPTGHAGAYRIPAGTFATGAKAFSGCRALTAVTIPASVVCIGQWAFSGCASLTSVTFEDAPPAAVIDADMLRASPRAAVHISRDHAANWAAAVTGSIADGTAMWQGHPVRVISEWTFDGADTLKHRDTPWALAVTVTASGIGLTVSGAKAQPPAPVLLPLDDAVAGGYRITGFSENAFGRNTGITAVTIPASVTGIGRFAFQACTNLTALTIAEGVASIDPMAFAYCPGLTGVTIPSSVTNISETAFSDCTGLTNITVAAGSAAYRDAGGVLFSADGKRLAKYPLGRTGAYRIPTGTTGIDGYAFSGCRGLTAVTIPKGVTHIGKWAFLNCGGLKTLKLPATLTSIGEEAFGRTWLDSITVAPGSAAFRDIGGVLFSADGKRLIRHPNPKDAYDIPPGVTHIGDWAFAYHAYLFKHVTIPPGVTHIGDGAFSGCYSLTNALLPASVTSIGSQAFESCQNMTGTAIPPGVTHIGRRAFGICSGLTDVTIPSSTTNIGISAFDTCAGLSNITVAADSASYRDIGGVLFTKDSRLLVQYPAGKAGAYAIPEGTAAIEWHAFWGCGSLTAVTVPGSVTNIGLYAFSHCGNLTNITFQGGCPDTGKNAEWGYWPAKLTFRVPRAHEASWAAAVSGSLTDGTATWMKRPVRFTAP